MSQRTDDAGVHGWVLRLYGPEDSSACLSVFTSNVPGYFTEAERPEFEAFLGDLPGPYFVLVDDAGEVLGCGGYASSARPNEVDLCWGMVRQELHGRGIGRALTELRLSEARRAPDVRGIRLNTSQHTTGFYERLGFRLVSVEEDGYAPGLHRCDMVLEVS